MTQKPRIPLSDDALEQLLKRLPREKASANFLQKTLAATPVRNQRPLSPLVWVMAGVLFSWLLLGWIFPSSSRNSNLVAAPSFSQTDAEENLDQLQRMSVELKELQHYSSGNPLPVLRLGEGSSDPYLLHLRNLAEATSETTYASFKPTRSF